MFWNPSHASEVTISSDTSECAGHACDCLRSSWLLVEVRSQACLRRLRLLRSHFTSPLFAIDINLDLMKIALMIFYDEIVLSSTRILRFIVFSLAFYEIIRQKPRGNIRRESSCWWLYYGDLNSFFHSSKRNILLRLWWTISQSDQQHTFTTATSAEKSSSINDTTTRFSGSLLKSLSSLFTKLSCLFVEISSRLFAHSVN